MAGHEWDWFQREELIGQISDIRVQNLQVERENVQKRTFTRWINLHLEKCSPPLEVNDLFVDIQDGKILMALLEVLTGQSLLHEYKSSTHRIFRLNNIAKALKFLEDSNVKLVSIDAAEIADGNPSLVLGLIWNIILFLQIKELTGNLNRMSSSSSLSSLPSGSESDTSHPSTPSTEKSMSISIKDQRKAIKALLNWVQQRTRKYGVAVQDFAGSWRSGLAFLAVIKAIDSSLVDIRQALEKPPRDNLEDAFSIAQRSLRIPRLLEPEDVMVDSPDEHSIMTYVTQFLEHFPELDPDDFTDQNEEVPLEMTYVHYKDGPTEEEGKIITLSRKEANDYTVEVETRPLTPPETHDYAEVDIPDDSKSNSEKSIKNPFQLSAGMTQSPMLRAEGGFKLDRVSRRLEMSLSTSDVSEKRADAKGTNEEGNIGGLGGLLNGEDALHHTDSIGELGPSSTSGVSKEHGTEYMLGPTHKNINNFYSSISDKKPEVHQVDNGTVKPSDNSDLLPPYKTNEKDDTYKYVLHLPKDGSRRNPTKQMTVFQAYRASTEDQPDHKSHLLPSDVDSRLEDTNVMDSPFPPKVSIIPHDLFYYPHYSVPIADVLKAFADTCPDSKIKMNMNSDASSEGQAEDNEPVNGGVYLDTEMTENGVSVEESEELTLDGEGTVQDVRYTKTGSPERPVGSISNGPTSQATHDLQGSTFTVDPVYKKTYQLLSFKGVGSIASSEKNLDGDMTGRTRHFDRKADLEEEDFQEIEDRAAKLAAEVEEDKFKDPWFSRDVQSDSRVHNRRELNFPQLKNFGAFQNVTGDGDQRSELRNQGFGDAAPSDRAAAGSRPPISDNLFPEMYYLAVLLWFLCYCVLILPELDVEKVSFFADNN